MYHSNVAQHEKNVSVQCGAPVPRKLKSLKIYEPCQNHFFKLTSFPAVIIAWQVNSLSRATIKHMAEPLSLEF